MSKPEKPPTLRINVDLEHVSVETLDTLIAVLESAYPKGTEPARVREIREMEKRVGKLTSVIHASGRFTFYDERDES